MSSQTPTSDQQGDSSSPNLAQIGQFFVDQQNRANGVEAVAEEIELLCRDLVQIYLNDGMAEAKGDLENVLRRTLSEAVQRMNEADAPEVWEPREYPYAATVSHGGGTWRCAARSGASERHEPNPASGVWVPAAVGIAGAQMRSIRPDSVTIDISLSDGRSSDVKIPLPVMRMEGTWNPKTAYRPRDVVTRNGGSFAARVDVAAGDDPATNENNSWQMIAARGKTGPAASQRDLEALRIKLESGANLLSASERVRLEIADSFASARENHPAYAHDRKEWNDLCDMVFLPVYKAAADAASVLPGTAAGLTESDLMAMSRIAADMASDGMKEFWADLFDVDDSTIDLCRWELGELMIPPGDLRPDTRNRASPYLLSDRLSVMERVNEQRLARAEEWLTENLSGAVSSRAALKRAGATTLARLQGQPTDPGDFELPFFSKCRKTRDVALQALHRVLPHMQGYAYSAASLCGMILHVESELKPEVV